jgi:hypothetical protein
MRKVILSLVIVIIGMQARAEVFGTAYPLKPEKMTAGGQAQVFVNPSEFALFGHFGYGLMPKLELNGHLGFGNIDTMLGADAKYLFYDEGKMAFSGVAGLHLMRKLVIDLRGIGSYKFKDFIVSSGLDINWLMSGDSIFGVALFGGINYPMEKNIEIVGDIGINIKDSWSWISGGAIYRF